ncbi:MAG: AAA family ATPase [Candidatus Fimivivens sp.]
MKSYPVFAISRQYGSGGRDIGLALSKKLGIPFYDNELITLAAQESGFAPELFKNADHNASSSLLFTLSMYGSTTGTFNMPLGDQVFLIQSDIIKKVASEGPCVIIGRCADYILRDFPNRVSIFLHAPLDQRIERVVENSGVASNKAKDIVTKTDKKRSVYYSHFTGEKWGASGNYHITMDTARMGITGALETLALIADQLSRPR